MGTTAAPPTIMLQGVSGRTYTFLLFPWGTAFNPVAAVYAILRYATGGQYDVLYVGETENLNDRLTNHHKQWCVDLHGKTHVGVLMEPSAAGRLAIEADLVSYYKAPCND